MTNKLKDYFNRGRLATLYRQGKLKAVLRQFSSLLNVSTFLGKGRDCVTFSDHENKKVYKLVHKKTHYFLYANTKTARDFYHETNVEHEQLAALLLPIEKILYEDKYCFLYVQPRCRNLSEVPHIFQCSTHCLILFLVNVLNLLLYLLQSGLWIKQMGAHSFGYYENRVLLFDYHGIRSIKPILDSSKEWEKYGCKIIGVLVYYFYCLFFPKDTELHSYYSKHRHRWDKEKIQHQRFFQDKMPRQVVQLFKSLVSEKKSVTHVAKKLKSCLVLVQSQPLKKNNACVL